MSENKTPVSLKNAPEPLTPMKSDEAVKLTDEQLEGVSGGGLFDRGFNYKVGDTWKGMCKTCGHCSEDRTFTCVYSYAPGDGKYNYTWWRCSTCGAVWRWVPDSIWGGDWDKAYWDVNDMKEKDPLVRESLGK